MKKLILPFIVIVLVIAGVFGWSYINRPTSIPIAKIHTVTPTQMPVTPTPTALTTPAVTETLAQTSTLTFVNPSVAIDSFTTAIPIKKYGDMAEYMTPNVTVIKYGTSCCGLLTKAKAISEMSYLSGAIGPWNFEMTNPVYLKLQNLDPGNFLHAYVGTSSNWYAVGLELNDNYLITKVVLVGDYRLITGQ
jgi:hypothetical protein